MSEPTKYQRLVVALNNAVSAAMSARSLAERIGPQTSCNEMDPLAREISSLRNNAIDADDAFAECQEEDA